MRSSPPSPTSPMNAILFGIGNSKKLEATKEKKKRKEKDNCNQYIHPRGKRVKKESTAGGNFYFYFNQHCKTCRNAENTNKCVKLDV